MLMEIIYQLVTCHCHLCIFLCLLYILSPVYCGFISYTEARKLNSFLINCNNRLYIVILNIVLQLSCLQNTLSDGFISVSKSSNFIFSRFEFPFHSSQGTAHCHMGFCLLCNSLVLSFTHN